MKKIYFLLSLCILQNSTYCSNLNDDDQQVINKSQQDNVELSRSEYQSSSSSSISSTAEIAYGQPVASTKTSNMLEILWEQTYHNPQSTDNIDELMTVRFHYAIKGLPVNHLNDRINTIIKNHLDAKKNNKKLKDSDFI